MSALVYSVPGQTEGRMKPFLERTSINLFSELFLKCEGNVTIIKVFIIIFLLLEIGNTLTIPKTNH